MHVRNLAGQPSPHLTDQVWMYSNFEYKPMHFELWDILANLESTKVLLVPISTYLGLGRMFFDGSHLAKAAVYVDETTVSMTVDGSLWIAWNIIQQWQHPKVKVYKCQNEWGTLCVHIRKNLCLARGPAAFFVGKAF